jgi:S1-C subfamily serine protease
MIRFACPKCKTILQAPDQAAGSRLACGRCGQQLQLPASPAKAPAPAAPPSRPAAAAPSATGVKAAPRRPTTPPAARTAPARSPAPPPPTLAETQRPAAPPKPAVRPLWKRFLGEVGAVSADTFAQTLRPPAYLRGLWRCCTLRCSARAAEISLGQRLYESHAGDAGLRGRIRALDERIRGGQAGGRSRAKLENERQALLLQLAAPALAAPKPAAGAETEYARAAAARKALQVQEGKVKQARAGLLPAGWTGWRRVAIGYAVAGCVLFLAVAVPLALRRPPSVPEPQPVAQAPIPRPQLTTEQIVAASEKSVAFLRCGKMSGTGFLVRPGLLATNAHVVFLTPVNQLKIYFPSAEGGKEPLAAKRLLLEDKKRDLAFLEIESPLPPLSIAPEYTFKRGQSVTVIGNPSLDADVTLQNAVSQGLMSTETKLNDHEFYQLSIAVNPGNSGGPVFDSTGQVIGVVTLKATQQESVAFCVPCKDLNAWLAWAQQQEPEAIARATSQHDLEAVFRRLAMAGGMYLSATRTFLNAGHQAQAQGAPPALGMDAARKLLAKSLEQGDQELVEELKDTVTQVGANPLLEETQRKQVLDLLATYRDIKKHAQESSGNLKGYAARAQELNNRYKQLVDALKAALHVDDSE